MPSITHNLIAIRGQIEATARQAQRDPASIQLVAISKTHPVEKIQEAIAAGQRCFGENRVQEAQQKFSGLRAQNPDLALHLIGALQTNKAEAAVQLFDVIETLDRPKLAKTLADAMRKTGRRPRLYVEVNIGEEPQKAGILPQLLPEFLATCRDEHGLAICGLMCLPPAGRDPVPFFEQLRRLADRHALPHRSMGMSSDFSQAIQCGATAVRIGTAIFGSR